MRTAERFRAGAGRLAAVLAFAALAPTSVAAQAAARETPLSMVEALHAAFGEHHDRAVHTKGVVFEGTFTPAAEARSLTRAPVFTGGKRQIIGRFSVFAGVPTLPDNDDAASPAGVGIKIKGDDGDDFDIEVNQHNNFITKTSEEFAVFLRALGASGPGVAHPTPVEQFLATHPKAAAFLASRTYPASYAQATYFGINALKFTNAQGRSVFVRYRLVPRAPERYLTPDERKAAGPRYLQDEIAARIGREPVVFDWYAQVAGAGDVIDDPSTAWPETRRMVKLGTFRFTAAPADPQAVAKPLLLLPGQPHPGVEAADPMLTLRNTAYPISLGERQ